jgi:hypothetical protein
LRRRPRQARRSAGAGQASARGAVVRGGGAARAARFMWFGSRAVQRHVPRAYGLIRGGEGAALWFVSGHRPDRSWPLHRRHGHLPSRGPAHCLTHRRMDGADGVRFPCRRTGRDPRRSCLAAPCDRAGGGEVAVPGCRRRGRGHDCDADDSCARRGRVPDGPRFRGVADLPLCLAEQRPGGSRSAAAPVLQSAPGCTREVLRCPLRPPLKADRSARLRAGSANP